METRIQNVVVHFDDIEFALHRSGAKGQDSEFSDDIGPGSDGSSADKLSLDLKFNPLDTVITYQPGELLERAEHQAE